MALLYLINAARTRVPTEETMSAHLKDAQYSLPDLRIVWTRQEDHGGRQVDIFKLPMVK